MLFEHAAHRSMCWTRRCRSCRGPTVSCRSAGIRDARCWCIRRAGLAAAALAHLLRTMQAGATMADLQADVASAAAWPTPHWWLSWSLRCATQASSPRERPSPANPRGVHPHPRPRTAVGPAGQRAAVLGCPDPAEQSQPRRRHIRDGGPGGAVGLPGGRSAGGSRPARRPGAASAGAGARRRRSGRARW